MKVLLSSVFGPYGVDDDFGRKENPIELFHNQITREQGVFSIRAFNPSFGLYVLAESISPPTRVLDFPSLDRFVTELEQGYDYVGISFIMPSYVKAKRMAEIVRQKSPGTKIVLGGHGVQVPEVEREVPHDYICRGDGVRFLRELLGEDPDTPVVHPVMHASFGTRLLGVPGGGKMGFLCPGLGCPKRCRFCATSHFYRGRYVPYLETGQEVFDVCRRIEDRLGLQEFTVLDENFLLKRKRAVELLDLMRSENKPYRFDIFSSADTVQRLGVDFLAELGVTRLWVGVESKFDTYGKNEGIDLQRMIKQLRDHGIGVIASAILFSEEHDKETIWEDIRFVADLAPDFVQFMQLGLSPRTELYKEYRERGLLREDVPYEEWHGQHRIWFHHPHFTPEESERYLRDAFRYDYDTLGASLVRSFATLLRGYQTLRARGGDPFMAQRVEYLKKAAETRRVFLPAALAHAHNDRARQITMEVMEEYERVFGPMTQRQTGISGMLRKFADREAQKVERGENVSQPPTRVTDFRM